MCSFLGHPVYMCVQHNKFVDETLQTDLPSFCESACITVIHVRQQEITKIITWVKLTNELEHRLHNQNTDTATLTVAVAPTLIYRKYLMPPSAYKRRRQMQSGFHVCGSVCDNPRISETAEATDSKFCKHISYRVGGPYTTLELPLPDLPFG